MADQSNQDNRAFYEMLSAAKKRLEQRPAEALAHNTGAVFNPEASVFEIPTLGRTCTLTYPGFECREPTDEWFQLLLLHYMDLADGSPVSGAFVPFADQKEGLIRGTKFDRTASQALGAFLAGKSPEQIDAVCESLGASFVKSNADRCAILPFLPHYPVALKIWFADEEFPPEGKMLLNESASHYLTIEDAVVAGELILRELDHRYHEQSAGKVREK